MVLLLIQYVGNTPLIMIINFLLGILWSLALYFTFKSIQNLMLCMGNIYIFQVGSNPD